MSKILDSRAQKDTALWAYFKYRSVDFGESVVMSVPYIFKCHNGSDNRNRIDKITIRIRVC